MYGNSYMNTISQQANLDRINAQINELEKMKHQLQQPIQQPTNLTQNFQLAPTNRDVIKYASSFEEVEGEAVIGDTPYFSKDMSVVWIKNVKGEIKTFELNEIIPRDEKDIQIEMLQAKIKELERKNVNEQIYRYDDESIEDEKSSNVSIPRTSTKKSKQSTGDI